MVAVILSGCSTPSKNPEKMPADPAIVQLTSSARAAYEHGAIERAARFYEQALDRAWVSDDSAEVGRSAYNLAACFLLMGKYDEARSLLDQAKSEFERSGLSVADTLVLDAKAARLQNKPEDAARLADELFRSKAEPVYRLQVAMIRADMACDAADEKAAEEALKQINKYEQEAQSPALRAAVAGVQGRIFMLKGKHEDAAGAFDRESRLYQKDGRFREMAQSLARQADAWRAGGKSREAADHYYRAARSLHAQGDDLGALRNLKAAVTMLDKTEDSALARQTAELFDRVKKSVDFARRASAAAP